MGFKQAKHAILTALREGRYLPAQRDSPERNWLATGAVDLEFVLQLVSATRGSDAEEKFHHQIPGATVWQFKPYHQGARWYVKCYFLGEVLWLVSVHPEGMHREGR